MAFSDFGEMLKEIDIQIMKDLQRNREFEEETRDLFKRLASERYRVPYEEVTATMRAQEKVASYRELYGMRLGQPYQEFHITPMPSEDSIFKDIAMQTTTSTTT